MYGTAKRRKQERQQSADERQERYDALDLQQKYLLAITRGHEGTREALRLAAAIKAAS